MQSFVYRFLFCCSVSIRNLTRVILPPIQEFNLKRMFLCPSEAGGKTNTKARSEDSGEGNYVALFGHVQILSMQKGPTEVPIHKYFMGGLS